MPVTTLRDLEAKYTRIDPFDPPQALLERIESKDYGRCYDEQQNSVPVNFLTTVNGKGEFIGLVSDGTYDSINADWEFNDNTRAIRVDVEYVLWVMEKGITPITCWKKCALRPRKTNQASLKQKNRNDARFL